MVGACESPYLCVRVKNGGLELGCPLVLERGLGEVGLWRGAECWHWWNHCGAQPQRYICMGGV